MLNDKLARVFVSVKIISRGFAPYNVMSSNISEKSKGRPLSDIWNRHMIQGAKQSRGHYSATCGYCQQYWRQGRPQVLRAHLANHCKVCPDDVSSYYAKIVGKSLGEEETEGESTDDEDFPNKKQKVRQTDIKSFYGGSKLEKGRSDELDRVITKAYIMCNIPFSTIDNPWFIEMIKALQPGYDPPSRRVLGGTLLEAELSRVNTRVNNELDKQSNFTIGRSIIPIIRLKYFIKKVIYIFFISS
jgi:hypothetical protein